MAFPKLLLAAALTSSITTPSLAKDEPTPKTPKEFRELMSCRTIADTVARLACFDHRAAELDTATRTNEVVITDREAIQSARRGLFGFATPAVRLLGIGRSDENEIKQIDSTITRATRLRDDGWRVGLEDGSTWETNDTRTLVRAPQIGNSVKIKRGALGVFFVEVNNQRAIKMRRIQ